VDEALARELTSDGILSDPWLDGRPRFRDEPLVLSQATHAVLARAAQELTAAWHEAALLCAADPSLMERFFALTPFLRLMWDASAPAWHGIARADVFQTADGPRICELNCDTPSGEAEATLLNAAAHARAPHLVDPNVRLEPGFTALIEAAAQRPGPLTIGILYPTELVEDLSMIALYRRWLMGRGHRVVLGAPFNLQRVGGRAALFDTPCDVFVRHYKTDWWAERQGVFRDDPEFPDAEPLARELGILLQGISDGSCAVVNPFGAVVPQNKRTMALMWECIERFSPRAQEAIRAHLPFTARLEAVLDEVRADRAGWVLKSDYGCEGAEVIVGAEVSDEIWTQTLAQARPERFVAQRRFVPLTDESGCCVNYGVYLVAGRFAGYFSRVHRGATGYDALAAATLVEAENG
jgi:glutathionylspermidine synthase